MSTKKYNKVYLPSQPNIGIGTVLSQKWSNGKLVSVRVYFDKIKEVATLNPNDVLTLHEDDN